jgi:predicted dehydrogenase
MAQVKCTVALVGCGQIADAHLQEIRKVPGAQLVAVCDRHPDLARQAAQRFGVPRTYDDLGRLLAEVRPDVLHITTPPHTHLGVAKQALAAGAHIYVEKPFALTVREADEILEEARARDRLVCVGHDQLFDPAWEECRRRHQRGELGRIIHIDSVQGYALDGPFGRAFLEDEGHWVHRLPGYVFQNVMSHALYRITEFLTDEDPHVWARWFGNKGVTGTPTELRVMLQGSQTSATLVFTSAARPVQRIARVYGERASVEVDLDARLVRRLRAPGLPGPFGKMDVPVRHAFESLRAATRAAWRFVCRDLHYFAGMNRLFQLFYRAVAERGPPPVPYAEIRRVTAVMDAIFARCRQNAESPLCQCGAETGAVAGRDFA